MANIYTKDDETLNGKVFLLNGNTLTHSLETDGAINPIPSLKLVDTLNTEINERIDSVEDDIENLSVDNTIPENGYIISSLCQRNGLISYGTRRIKDQDFQENTISQNKIKGLVEDLGNISSQYLLSSDFNKTLADSFRYDPDMKSSNDFRYDSKEHQLHLKVGGTKDMIIDLSEIIKGQIISDASVVEIDGVKYIKITFASTEIDPIFIRIDSFFNLYKAGRGIKITDTLSVLIDDDIVADKVFVRDSIGEIQSDSGTLSGVIRNIKQTNGKNEITTGSITSADFEFYDGGEKYHHSLPIEYVSTLKERLQSIEDTDWRTLKFNGHIKDSTVITDSHRLSDIFFKDIFDMTKVYNGSFIHTDFEEGVISAKLIDEDLTFYKGDYLIIHDHDNTNKEVDKSSIEYGVNAFMIRSGNSRGDIEDMVSKALLSAKTYTNEVSTILSSSLTVSVGVESGTEDNIISVYTIKQGGNGVEEKIKIPKTKYNGLSSDTISVTVNGYDISADIRNNSISICHLDDTLSGEIFFKKGYGTQTVEVSTLFNNVLCADYKDVLDTKIRRLSDVVKVEDDFGSMYNGIVNIINECELKDIDFTLNEPVISAYNSINKIAVDDKIDVDVHVDLKTATVTDGFNALSTIIRDAKYEGHRNLDKELKKIDERFDINERSIGAHTKEISELKEKINTLESRLKDIEDILRGKDIFVK